MMKASMLTPLKQTTFLITRMKKRRVKARALEDKEVVEEVVVAISEALEVVEGTTKIVEEAAEIVEEEMITREEVAKEGTNMITKKRMKENGKTVWVTRLNMQSARKSARSSKRFLERKKSGLASSEFS
jgi:hypothetical protein